jgi:hypothetical protein
MIPGMSGPCPLSPQANYFPGSFLSNGQTFIGLRILWLFDRPPESLYYYYHISFPSCPSDGLKESFPWHCRQQIPLQSALHISVVGSHLYMGLHGTKTYYQHLIFHRCVCPFDQWHMFSSSLVTGPRMERACEYRQYHLCSPWAESNYSRTFHLCEYHRYDDHTYTNSAHYTSRAHANQSHIP